MPEVTECAVPGCYYGTPAWDTLCTRHRKDNERLAREARERAAGPPPEQADLFAGPALPYDGNTSSGWAGSDTSRERAEAADTSGVTADRQVTALAWVRTCEAAGSTWGELSAVTGWHHGTCSGVLSNLQAAGELVRLQERRGTSQVYVHPDYAGGRPEAPRRATAGTRQALEVLEHVDHLLALAKYAEARRVIASARVVLATP